MPSSPEDKVDEIELTEYESRILSAHVRAVDSALAARDGAISMIFARAGIAPRQIASIERDRLVLVPRVHD